MSYEIEAEGDRRQQRGGDIVKTEAEIGVMQPRARDCLGPVEAGANKEFSLSSFRCSTALLPPWFQISGPQN